MLKLVDVTKKYTLESGDLYALNSVNLEIKNGEFVIMIGRSGSGKSTLLNIISGIDKPTSGDILYYNTSLSKSNEKTLSQYRKTEIGIVFQKFQLLYNSTVFDNVALPLKIAGKNAAQQKVLVKKALEDVGLSDRINSLVNKLSGGQQQRVAIARAIVSNPKILICDEPTGNLDTKTGKEIVDLLRKLNRSGITVILVTHNQEYLSSGDRKIEISDGKINLDENKAKNENDSNDHFCQPSGNLSFFSISKLAWRNLIMRKLRFFITSFGISIGAIAIVVLVSFAAGLQKTNDDLLKSFSLVEEITVSGTKMDEASLSSSDTKPKPLDNTTVEKLKKISGVKDVYPVISFNATGESNGKTASIYLDSSKPLANTPTSLKDKVVYGRYFNDDNENSIILPYYYLENFNFIAPSDLINKEVILKDIQYYVGDDFQLKTSDKEFKLTVVGIYGEKEMSAGIVVPNKKASDINLAVKSDGKGSDKFLYDTLTVLATNPESVASVKESIEKEGFGATSFEDMAKGMEQFFLIFKIILGVIGSIALFVASLGVINTMFMAVLERTREIGLLRALGARRSDIRNLFIAESTYIGLFGGVVGLICGWAISKIMQFIVSTYTARFVDETIIVFYVPFYLALSVLAFSMFVTAIAGLLPAIRASRLNPITALREE
jgi:macrolide transport system ATP-binding/permease protein